LTFKTRTIVFCLPDLAYCRKIQATNAEKVKNLQMPESSGHIEGLDRVNQVKRGSDRSFGFVFTAVFLVIGLWPLLDGNDVRRWPVVAAIVLLIATISRPALLAPFNLVWFKFGQVLHRIVSPIVMGLLFYLAVTPTALIMRGLGKSPIDLKFDKTARSYWIERTPPGPEPETMKNQF